MRSTISSRADWQSGASGDSGSASARIAARTIIVLALVLEMQGPRLVGDVRAGLLLFVIGLYALLLLRSRQVIHTIYLAFVWPMVALLAYCVWCLASTIWSDSPVETALQSGLLLVTLLVALSYATISPKLFATEYVRIATVLALISWAMVPIVPDIAALPDITWRLNGPMQHSQRLALFIGAGVILWFVLRFKKIGFLKSKGRENAVLILLVITLLATQTRANTAFVLVVVGLLVFFHLESWKKLFVVALAGIAVWWLLANFEALLAFVDRDGSNTFTLTGRTVIWSNALALIEQNPVLGYSFASFYSPLTENFFSSGYIAPHAHNTWVNALFETGWIGAITLSAFFIGALFVDRGGRESAGFAWPLVLLSMLCGLMGIVFGGKVSTLWVIVTVMVAQSVTSRRASYVAGRRHTAQLGRNVRRHHTPTR